MSERTKGMGGHHSAAAFKEEWLTPPWLIEKLGLFDMDPCAPVTRPWPTAATYWTILDDGLKQPWRGSIWLNPPYGTKAASWLARLAAHDGGGIALIYARTETDMFFTHVWAQAHALLFLRGRLHFHHVDGTRAKANCGAPSVLVAYGCNMADRLLHASIDGQFMRLR